MANIRTIPARVETRFEHTFRYVSDREAGFSFPCREDGTLLSILPATHLNYQKCLTGVVDGEAVVDLGIFSHETRVEAQRFLKCFCGREVALYGFTNTCDCGADYNMSGQRLADRSQWGEETGEHLSDILMIP